MIRDFILKVLAENGGSYRGSLQLCEEVPASPQGVCQSLQSCRKRHLIKSIHSHGGRGRGHKTTHRLTAKGRREAANYILTQKGKDYVQSK
jgi:hypothetical protein